MGEYIDREAVMEALMDEQYGYLCEEAIQAIPNADVAPVRRGEWIDDYGESWRCSVCGAETYVDEDWRGKNDKDYKMNFCHYCGARMEADNG